MLRQLTNLFFIFVLVACGGGSDGNGEDNSSTDNNNSLAPNLEKNMPLAENAALPSSIDQSFACIDTINETYFQMDVATNGLLTINSTSLSNASSLSLSGNALNLTLAPADLNTLGFGASSFSYQNVYHLTAGDMLVAFLGNVNSNEGLACMTIRHNFTDKVNQEITFNCQNFTSTANDYSSTTTNVFTLTPTGYAERNSSYSSYSGGVNGSLSFSGDNPTQYGTYLFDSQSGEFVMGFMRITLEDSEADLRIFEGNVESDDSIYVQIDDERKLCTY